MARSFAFALVPALLLAASPALAAEPAPAPPPTTAPDDAPSVRALVGRLEACTDLDCEPIRALVARGQALWPDITHGLEGQPEMTRFWTLGVLSEVVIPDARETLEGLLAGDGQIRIRAAAAFALGNMRDKAVVPALTKALADKDVNVRFEAASALGRSPGVEAVPALLKALRDSDDDVRAAVIEALAATGDPRAIDPMLRRAERDPSPGVRGMAAVGLANLKAESAVEPLIARLGAELNPQALAAVCWALGELGDARAVAPVKGLLDHESAVVRQLAEEAVTKLEAPPAPKPDGEPSDEGR